MAQLGYRRCMSDTAITDPIVTLPERKARALARRRAAVERVSTKLAGFAREKGGRYLIFGSAARDELRFDSDLDLLVDFPPHLHAEAWRFAEDVCAEERMPADIRPLAWCSDEFVAHISRDLRILP